jgi:2-oxoglutarate dehydrogenase E2 component (dihydrolipoamide succinyltransferase)
MSTDVIIPALGESIASGILSSWKVKEGSFVEIDQPIYELETDKITQEGLAEVSGTISFLVQEGEEVEIGATIAKIDESADQPQSTESKEDIPDPDSTKEILPTADKVPAPSMESSPSAQEIEKTDIKYSPAVRKLLAESKLDPSIITGTGKGGRITKADVILAQQGKTEKGLELPPHSTTSTHAPQPNFSEPTSGNPTEERTTRRPLSPIRKRIAQRLVEAQQTAAILSTFNEVDLSAVMALRKTHQDAFVKGNGIKLGFMSFFVKAVVHALKAVPAVNVRLEGNELIENNYYDISVAVGTEKGLVVPVLRDCDQMSFAEIEQSILNYAEKARNGTISLEDMQGGCFTITNGGIYGSLLSTPIINPPQSGILGMHAIQERPVARNGEIVIRPMMYLAHSYDHRVIDGKEAVTFLVKIKEAIEEPARLALGI